MCRTLVVDRSCSRGPAMRMRATRRLKESRTEPQSPMRRITEVCVPLDRQGHRRFGRCGGPAVSAAAEGGRGGRCVGSGSSVERWEGRGTEGPLRILRDAGLYRVWEAFGRAVRTQAQPRTHPVHAHSSRRRDSPAG
jgi:hypothetical protein